MATKRRKAKRRTVTLGGTSQSAFAGSSMVKKPKGEEPNGEEPKREERTAQEADDGQGKKD